MKPTTSSPVRRTTQENPDEATLSYVAGLWRSSVSAFGEAPANAMLEGLRKSPHTHATSTTQRNPGALARWVSAVSRGAPRCSARAT